MTVCIAALADFGRSIVLVCDSMLSADQFSGDRTADKLFPIARSWWAMIAGSDLGHVMPVIESATLLLSHLRDADNTLEIVSRCVALAYQNERARLAEDMVLSPIGLTWALFRQNKEWQPHLIDKLQKIELGFQVIVAGFDWNADGHIFTVEHPGVPISHDVAGWKAIGVGEFGVQNTLITHSVSQNMELARVLYHTCEAKFVSESALGVGRYTQVKIPVPGVEDDALILSEEFVSVIRRAWEEEGRPRVPSGLVDVIREQLAKRPLRTEGQ